MKKLSPSLLAQIVSSKRKELNMTQKQLSDMTGINRAQLSRLEQQDYLPLIPQLEALGDALGFDLDDVFTDAKSNKLQSPAPLNIAVAGTGWRYQGKAGGACIYRLQCKRKNGCRRISFQWRPCPHQGRGGRGSFSVTS